MNDWTAFAASITMPAPVRGSFRIYFDAHVKKLQFVVEARDVDGGAPRELTTEHTITPDSWARRHAIVLEIVEALYAHEIREQLLFDGERVHDPHAGVSASAVHVAAEVLADPKTLPDSHTARLAQNVIDLTRELRQQRDAYLAENNRLKADRRAAGHRYDVEVVAGKSALHTGRPLYRVTCLTCDVVVHPETTAPLHQQDHHEREVEAGRPGGFP